MVDFQSVLDDIYTNLKDEVNRGLVASYIPELSNIDAQHFGIYLKHCNGESYSVGDWNHKFSIQSISKVFSKNKHLLLI